jgi:hypothetical protein
MIATHLPCMLKDPTLEIFPAGKTKYLRANIHPNSLSPIILTFLLNPWEPSSLGQGHLQPVVNQILAILLVYSVKFVGNQITRH